MDLILANEDIDELCKKIPLNQQELQSEKIKIADALKKKPYMMMFLEEIKHFVETEEIIKSKFTIRTHPTIFS